MLFANKFRVEDRSKDRINTRVIEWGKRMLYGLSLLLDTETCTIKGSFVSLRICVFLRCICVHAPRARVRDISISLYRMLIALFLLFVFFTRFQM